MEPSNLAPHVMQYIAQKIIVQLATGKAEQHIFSLVPALVYNHTARAQRAVTGLLGYGFLAGGWGRLFGEFDGFLH